MSDSNKQNIMESIDLNKKAGELVKNKNYREAMRMYSEAIARDPNNPVFYSNRSLCHEKLENYGHSVQDASKAIKIDKNFVKGYFRRGIAQLCLGHLKEALEDFKHLYILHPKEKTIADRYHSCLKTYKEKMLAKAIEYVAKSAFDQIDISSLSISDIDPKLAIPEDKISIEYISNLMQYLKEGKIFPVCALNKLLILARDVLKSKKTLVRYTIPENAQLTICGDVHGQYYDLLHIFEMNGMPSLENNYLFNGDFVDRGSFSVEVIVLLLSFQICFPDHFMLNRGNHETLNMNEIYGFKEEVMNKYSKITFDLFCELFRYLPIAHLINDKVLVMHGGLPADDNITLTDIENISRFREPTEGTPMFDLLWTDPQINDGRSQSPRGVSMCFGPDVTKNFCERNNLLYVVRSHESQMEGYKLMHDQKCLTIFSAPNYCDEMKNKGAIIRLKKDLKPVFVQFEASPHPPAKKYMSNMFN